VAYGTGMDKRTAVVTGATGYVGSHLVPALVDQGWSVRAAGRRPRPEWMTPDVDYRSVDLAGDDDEALAQLCAGATHVLHLAGASSSLSSEDEMDRSNRLATERLLAAIGDQVERMVYVSSTSVYGEEEALPLPVREDTEPHPSRGYGKAKWRAEQLVWAAGAAGLPVVVMRPVSVYGPGNVKLLGSAVLDVAIERFAGSRRLLIPAEPIEQRLVHIDDVVAACLHLAVHDRAVGRAFNVVFPEYPSSHQVAGILATALGLEAALSDDPECGPDYPWRQAVHRTMLAEGMAPDILLTRERFRFMRKANRNNRLSVDALLGTGFEFSDRGLEEGIRSTVAWYLDHGWII
ncbi:MAG: NAD(P)-dependent oxidoreductase, partial [Actinomycetota bacterium]|nr:NAD(P)-dependent oxidoreductase [Actinomycetota bacterium]